MACSRYSFCALLPVLIACAAPTGSTERTAGQVPVTGPRIPARYIHRKPASDPRLDWIRIKLSPGQTGRGYRYVLGICAKEKGSPRPFCSGGTCDARDCRLDGGESFTYRFLGDPPLKNRPAPPVPPLLEIRWRGRLGLQRPGLGVTKIELSAYDFRDGLRFAAER